MPQYPQLSHGGHTSLLGLVRGQTKLIGFVHTGATEAQLLFFTVIAPVSSKVP